MFLAPFLEALQPLLLADSNSLQSLVGNLGPVPEVDPAVEVESKYISLLVCGQASNFKRGLNGPRLEMTFG